MAKQSVSLGARKKSVSKKFIGGSGTELFGGYLFEDYLSKLNGPERIPVFEEMRRGDAQIIKILRVLKGPIRGARFEFEASGDTEAHKKAAEFADWNWNKNPFISFKKFVNEQLTMLDFGCAVHEYINTAYNHPEFGMVHITGGLGFRKQSTIYEWRVDGSSGLEAILQIAQGDTIKGGSNTIEIPASQLIVNTNDLEGDNYEGIALLRACYGPWFRKNTYLKLIAIGMEKAAIGTPVGSFPTGVEDEGDKTKFQQSLLNLSQNEQNFVMKPSDYVIEIVKNEFDADKMLKAVDYEDGQIAGAALVSFLELGKGGGGAFALSQDLSDIALLATKYIGGCITEAMDKPTRELVAMNFGNPDLSPNIKVVGIDKKAGKEFAEVLKIMVDAGVIRVDDRLEKFVRKSADLPEIDLDSVRVPEKEPELENTKDPSNTNKTVKPSQPPKDTSEALRTKEGTPEKKPIGANFQEDFTPFRDFTEYESPIDFNEISSEFDNEELKLKNLFTTRLKSISAPLLKDFANRLKNRKGSRVAVAEKTNFNDTAYAKAIESQSQSQITLGIKSGKRDLQTKIDKFSSGSTEIKLSADFAEENDKIKVPSDILTPDQKDTIGAQARAQAKTHKDEIEKIVVFGTIAGEANGLTDEQLVRELEKDVDKFIDSPRIATAAKTMTSQNLNKARAALFSAPVMKDVISALQYSAVLDSRTTAICRSLDGRVFSPRSASNFIYTPPNHFNCRSILIPITVFEPKPTVGPLVPDPNNPALGNLSDKDGKPLSKKEILKTKNL